MIAQQVDTSVTFGDVGGLDAYVKSLKEMVFLPLIYPELFTRFHVSPPRGVLFYGPPGESGWPARKCGSCACTRGVSNQCMAKMFFITAMSAGSSAQKP